MPKRGFRSAFCWLPSYTPARKVWCVDPLLRVGDPKLIIVIAISNYPRVYYFQKLDYHSHRAHDSIFLSVLVT